MSFRMSSAAGDSRILAPCPCKSEEVPRVRSSHSQQLSALIHFIHPLFRTNNTAKEPNASPMEAVTIAAAPPTYTAISAAVTANKRTVNRRALRSAPEDPSQQAAWYGRRKVTNDKHPSSG